MENRIDLIEERLAHLLKSVDDLSDVVARQEKEISVLTRRVRMLMEREAARIAANRRWISDDGDRKHLVDIYEHLFANLEEQMR